MIQFGMTLINDQLEIALPDLDECRAIVIKINGQEFKHELKPRAAVKWELKTVIREFITYLQVNEDRKNLTIKGYRNRLGQFSGWVHNQGRNPSDPETWRLYYAHLKGKGLSPYTVKGHYHILNRFGVWLTENEYISENPIEDVNAPRLPKEDPPKAALRDTIKAMLDVAIDPRDRTILLLFYDSGLRATEAISLSQGDLNFEERMAWVKGKGDRYRPIFWGPETNQALKLYLETLSIKGAQEPLLWGRKGPLTYEGLYKIFKRLGNDAGKQGAIINPHSYRHAFGRDTTQNGIPTKLLQKLFGHSSITTTERYGQADPGDLKEAHDRFSPLGSVI